ncbi:MAG: ACP S-malonyltransferase [Xanthomonadales bacterium]|nr:ACP S-malonyltransferase [Xanthomonadales bacterium]
MDKTAFLFPGQGSQAVGMMTGLERCTPLVREVFDTASEVLGFDLGALVRDGPAERLDQTEFTQPALLAASIATWRAWQSLGGGKPDYLAGHSLGEYSALVAAEAIDFSDAIAVVAARGRHMQSATPAGGGAMAAILGVDDAVLERICEEAAQGQIVSCANFNSPGQVVLAGDREAVQRACVLAGAAGARRAIPLSVSVPSHCALMHPAAAAMQTVLEKVEIRAPRVPVIHNVDAAPHEDPAEIRQVLTEQLKLPVRWSETVRKLAAWGVTRCVECGPGKVLSGLNRRIARDLQTVAFSDCDTMKKTREEWS